MPNLHLPTYNGLIELITIDLTAFGGETYFFVNSRLDDGTEIGEVDFNGHTWTPLPFTSDGWKRGGEKAERPRITLPDFSGVLFVVLRNLKGAPGAPIIRYQALAADVIADLPGSVFTTERYLLNNYQGTGRTLALELATQMDFTRVKCPSFVMTRKHYPGLGSGLLR